MVLCNLSLNNGPLSTTKQASRDEQLLRKHLQAVYQDEQPLNRGSYLCPPTLRPRSVAVPGMTTSSSFSPSTLFNFLQEPQVRIPSYFHLNLLVSLTAVTFSCKIHMSVFLGPSDVHISSGYLLVYNHP